MDLKLIADVATIVGSLSIFLTLIFIVIELKKSVDQTKLVNNANRDLLHSEWLHFWSDTKNAELVAKGRDSYIELNTSEKFQFEQFIEQRIRLFVFALPTVQNETNLNFHYARARDFFDHSGAMDCYLALKERQLLAPPWTNFVDRALVT